MVAQDCKSAVSESSACTYYLCVYAQIYDRDACFHVSVDYGSKLSRADILDEAAPKPPFGPIWVYLYIRCKNIIINNDNIHNPKSDFIHD